MRAHVTITGKTAAACLRVLTILLLSGTLLGAVGRSRFYGDQLRARQ